MVDIVTEGIWNQLNNFIKIDNPLVYLFFKNKYPKLNNIDLLKVIECRIKSVTVKELYLFSYAYLEFKIITYTEKGIYAFKIHIELMDSKDDVFKKVKKKTELYFKNIYKCNIHELTYKIFK